MLYWGKCRRPWNVFSDLCLWPLRWDWSYESSVSGMSERTGKSKWISRILPTDGWLWDSYSDISRQLIGQWTWPSVYGGGCIDLF